MGRLDGVDADLYRFNLLPGQTASLALSSDDPTTTLTLLDGNGVTPLAAGLVGAANVGQTINDFVSGGGGTFFAG